MRHKPAGGIKSRQVTRKPVRVGENAREMRVKGVSQIGSHLGDHVTGKGKILRGTVRPVRGSLMPGVGAIPLGNQIAAETKCGVGGSRTIMRSGQQGTHGSVNPGRSPERRDILSEYGPNKR